MTRPIADFYETIGIETVSAEAGQARLRITNRAGLRNSRGEVHGGVISALADIAASQAARSLLAPGEKLATASLTISFISPGAGAELFAYAQVLRSGGTLSTVTVTVTNPAGDLVAHALGTVRLFRQRRRRDAAMADKASSVGG